MSDDMDNQGQDGLVSMDMETAQAEFERLCDSWNLSREYDSEDRQGVKSIIQYIQKGILLVKEGKGNKLVVEHKLHESLSKAGGIKTLTYSHIITEDLMGLDNIDASKTFAQGVEFVYAMSGMQRNLIKKMSLKDLSIGGAIGALFLVY